MKTQSIFLAGLISATFTVPAIAAVSPDEAKQLGATLTLWGAEKAGNKDGTIPAYVSTPLKAPPGWDPKSPTNRPDPFNEKPRFSITSQNYQQYADKLDGLAAVFKKYPNYRMDIYPTHRTQVYPQYVLDNSVKNATSCKLANDGNTLVGCYGGIPFPIPKTGQELMWNHLVPYQGLNDVFQAKQYVVHPTGSPVHVNSLIGWQNFPAFDPKRTTPLDPKAIFWRLRMDFTGPARSIGEKYIIIDGIDAVNVGRRAWAYIPGQRRVKLAPDLSYDTPAVASGGTSTMDSSKVFGGAIDRYDWQLVGKKEKFIPYNMFTLSDPKACPFDKLLTRSFPNPDCVRWEQHRVWIVKAKLKQGFRHIYPTRHLYFDEDMPGVGVGENYDAAGEVYRIPFNVSYPYFTEEGGSYIQGNATIEMDVIKGTYYVGGGTGDPGLGYQPDKSPKSEIFFSPEALAGEGIR